MSFAGAPLGLTGASGVTDHGQLTGLTPDDDHPHYALLAGRAGATNDILISTSGSGGKITGSSASAGDLTLRASSHATPGDIFLDAVTVHFIEQASTGVSAFAQFEDGTEITRIYEQDGRLFVQNRGPTSITKLSVVSGYLEFFGSTGVAGDGCDISSGTNPFFSDLFFRSLMSMTFAIDTNNNDTVDFFAWKKDGNASRSGGTELMRLVEAGQLSLPITGSAAGLLFGGDAQLFRGAANELHLAAGDSFVLVNGNVLISNTGTSGELRIAEPSGGGTSYTGFLSPALSGNVMYTLPTGFPPVNGDVLSGTTGGVLSWITPSGGSGLGTHIIARFTGTDARVNNTFANANDGTNTLQFAVSTSQTWVFTAVLRMDTAGSTPDMKVQFTGPAAVTAFAAGVGGNEAGLADPTHMNALSTSSGRISLQVAANTAVVIHGVIVTDGTNSGNVTLQWAQNITTGGTTVTMGATSFLHAQRIA